jgi:hypothetical protein
MGDAPEPPAKKLLAGYVPVPTAPIIYFDYAPTSGILSGVIQIELAARTLLPLANGSAAPRVVEVGRIRCSPAAAKALKEALEAALKTLEQPQSPPVAASKPN